MSTQLELDFKLPPKPLHMYVWHNVLADYTSGMICALADSLEQARFLVKAEIGERAYEREDIENNMPHIYDSPGCVFMYGGG